MDAGVPAGGGAHAQALCDALDVRVRERVAARVGRF
jgi:hypothetical protein